MSLPAAHMKRCPARAADGRQCCRPGPHPGRAHLVTGPTATREPLVKVAMAWGYPERLAGRAVDGFLDGGGRSRGPDAFVTATEMFANAMLDADGFKPSRPAVP